MAVVTISNGSENNVMHWCLETGKKIGSDNLPKQIEKMKGIDVVQSYLNYKLAAQMINYMASVIRKSVIRHL